MLLFQSKNRIQSQFLFSPFDQKTVRIKQKGNQNNPQKNLAYLQKHYRILCVWDILHQRILYNAAEYKEHRYRKGACEKIRHVNNSILTNPRYRHPRYQTHFVHA